MASRTSTVRARTGDATARSISRRSSTPNRRLRTNGGCWRRPASDCRARGDESMTAPTPLHGQVALVAGATRGAGRGIARALGEAGATVYCTGRSVRGNPSPYRRPETIEETAELIATAGGVAFAVRVDHTVEEEVNALVQRIDRERGRLDVLVNCIAGEEPMMHQWGSFWTTNLEHESGRESCRERV